MVTSGFGLPEFGFLLRGLLWTVALSLIAFIGGGAVGLAVALARTAERAWVRHVTAGYIAVFQGTPLLMQLFVVYYDPARHPELTHSVGLEKGHVGLVKAFADPSMISFRKTAFSTCIRRSSRPAIAKAQAKCSKSPPSTSTSRHAIMASSISPRISRQWTCLQS